MNICPPYSSFSTTTTEQRPEQQRGIPQLNPWARWLTARRQGSPVATAHVQGGLATQTNSPPTRKSLAAPLRQPAHEPRTRGRLPARVKTLLTPQTQTPERSHLFRIVKGGSQLPSALPEALVSRPLWTHARPQPRCPPLPGLPTPPDSDAPCTCSSSCALATATFTCSVTSPGSNFPPPKPPYLAPQSTLSRSRASNPQPSEAGSRGAPREE